VLAMKKLQYAVLSISLCLLATAGWGDTLKLKNGSTIIGTYAGGSESQVSFRVGNAVQQYDISDVASLTFDSYQPPRHDDDSASPRRDDNSAPPRRDDDSAGQRRDDDSAPRRRDDDSAAPRRDRDDDSNSASRPDRDQPPAQQSDPTYHRFSNNVTVPAGTRLVVRTIDAIDSDRNRVGDKFQASLDEPLYVNDLLVAPKGADVYGRLEEVKEAGHLEGRAQLKLALTSIALNGQTVAISTGDYELSGKSRGANTAKKVGGGAAIGAVIGAIAGGGKGAAIGAGVGAGAGTAVQVMTKGDQVHVPSETVLEFTLDQPITITRAQ
jgi:hypothetical protein